MKAVRIHEYGGVDVLRFQDAPRPEPGPGEVLVRVHAAGVNPVDWKVRAGYLKDWLKYKLPMIPGWDYSGVIESVGSGVDGWRAGSEVYARPDLSRDGAYRLAGAFRCGWRRSRTKGVDSRRSGRGGPLRRAARQMERRLRGWHGFRPQPQLPPPTRRRSADRLHYRPFRRRRARF